MLGSSIPERLLTVYSTGIGSSAPLWLGFPKERLFFLKTQWALPGGWSFDSQCQRNASSTLGLKNPASYKPPQRKTVGMSDRIVDPRGRTYRDDGDSKFEGFAKLESGGLKERDGQLYRRARRGTRDKGVWGIESILAVIGTGGPVKRSNIHITLTTVYTCLPRRK
eukprot:1177851-Prorocentrum_minimum.AAC.1